MDAKKEEFRHRCEVQVIQSEEEGDLNRTISSGTKKGGTIITPTLAELTTELKKKEGNGLSAARGQERRKKTSERNDLCECRRRKSA